MRLDHLLSKETMRFETESQNPRSIQENGTLKRTLFNLEGTMPSNKRWILYGGVAQLGEHLPCKQGVRSSILLISTIFLLRGKIQYASQYGLIAQVVRAHA